MAEVVIGEPPNFPIKLRWDDSNDTFDSLLDLGTYLQFVEEHEYRGTDESKPVFTDSSGARFRILVFALEVTLCVRVPDDYDPSQLRLGVFVDRETETVVEVLGRQVHRALSQRRGTPESFTAVAAEELEKLPALAWADGPPAPLSWLEFDEVWKFSVYKPRPFRFTDLIPRWLRRNGT